MGFGENVAKMQAGTVDRISELPEFILHIILSNLDTKEACRASVLSKRWFDAWSSIPVLDFRLPYFQKYGEYPYAYDSDTGERFVEFINKTMERYFKRKYRITKMYLQIPKVHGKIETLVDKWIMIAVQNQIQILEIHDLGIFDYVLPEILFRAKSLKYLKCSSVGLPFYATMDLISLEYLNLVSATTLDEDMLQRIISSCPLVVLDITYDNHLKKISIPWMKKVNVEVESRGSGTMQSNLQESPLQKFVYSLGHHTLWPWNMNIVALKNLRKLEFDFASITDDIVSELACGLVALESLVLSQCFNLKCIKISSNSLKQFRIANELHFIEVTIDAPKLLEFSYNTEIETSLSLIRVPDHCNAQFLPVEPDPLTTVWLVELKKFLVETNFFKSLVIELSNPPKILVDEDVLRNTGTGLPYKLSELKLCRLCGISAWNLTGFSVAALLDALFWCCHPDVLSITTFLPYSASELILNALKSKVHCYKHPLRSIELDSVDCSSLLSEPSKIETRFRLSWSQV